MSLVNEIWVSEILGIERNQGKGPDITNSGTFVEVKFSLINQKQENQSNYPKAWTVQEHQTEYEKYWAGQGFWGFGIYELMTPVSQITFPESESYETRNKRLENIVTRRTLYLTPWSFIYKFRPHETQGETKLSKWENVFRYVKLTNLPKTRKTYPVTKGLVHLTKKVPDYLFPNLK